MKMSKAEASRFLGKDCVEHWITERWTVPGSIEHAQNRQSPMNSKLVIKLHATVEMELAQSILSTIC